MNDPNFSHDPLKLPDIDSWIQYGVAEGAIYMFVVGDSDDVSPVYVWPDGDDIGRVEKRCWTAGHIFEEHDLTNLQDLV